MRAMALQSGSNGNCIYVQAGRTRLLFDAGISGKQAQLRLAGTGVDIHGCGGLFISHDHVDHMKSAGIFQRKFAVPLHVTERTLAAGERHRLGKLGPVQHFQRGDRVTVGDVVVETHPTPHDGADGSCFVVEAEGKRLGVLTDLGFVFSDLRKLIPTLDAVILESNYDADMLAAGPYPEDLKRRIRGEGGHISNTEAAELVARFGSRLQWVCLAHLSRDNNTPQRALGTHRQIVGADRPVHLATRYAPSDMLSL
ncbi:MAG: MBL fold metallo-hydrolase [Planctomycetes bacterium]|jgi:phosphoribosyl 1,2-cyclic phosphodiesterase|nr:MBL fold metallo-hydrolase [Phycisphaerae bacterium]NBB94723.1 MBL fold metallo-hydrolase [Planctomycetota bacterium]